jgi:hypothetical protein
MGRQIRQNGQVTSAGLGIHRRNHAFIARNNYWFREAEYMSRDIECTPI